MTWLKIGQNLVQRLAVCWRQAGWSVRRRCENRLCGWRVLQPEARVKEPRLWESGLPHLQPRSCQGLYWPLVRLSRNETARGALLQLAWWYCAAE